MKKIVAGAAVVALVSMNVAYAATVGTVTGGQNTPQNINSTWDGTSTPTGTTASGSDTVLVSAQVAPTLTLVISTGAINFGTLVPGAANTKSLTLTTATNAKDGVTVQMGSTGLATGGAATDKHIGGLARGSSAATTPATDTYQVGSTVTAGGAGLTTTNVGANQTVFTATDVPKANDTVTVSLTATAQAQTEAGNYGDTLTFTVTGNF